MLLYLYKMDFTRRKFLKSTTASAIALGVAPVDFFQSTTYYNFKIAGGFHILKISWIFNL